MIIKSRATVDDLYHVPENGKAELVNGELVKMSPTGIFPNRAASRIFVGLLEHEEAQGGGYAFNDNIAFLVNLPDRESFSPDVARYTGTIEEDDMDFVSGAPVFAVEVRSKGDYGPKAERSIADKIADYFDAGTLVVWDVDLQERQIIRKYSSTDPQNPTVFQRGEIADAEPAVSGWRLSVDTLFR
jgi:Uma2 family endonuclease